MNAWHHAEVCRVNVDQRADHTRYTFDTSMLLTR